MKKMPAFLPLLIFIISWTKWTIATLRQTEAKKQIPKPSRASSRTAQKNRAITEFTSSTKLPAVPAPITDGGLKNELLHQEILTSILVKLEQLFEAFPLVATSNEFLNSNVTKDEKFIAVTNEIGKLKELDVDFTGKELSKSTLKDYKQLKKRYQLVTEILAELTTNWD